MALTFDCRLLAGNPSSICTLAATVELTDVVETIERVASVERSTCGKVERNELGSRPDDEVDLDIAEDGNLMEGASRSGLRRREETSDERREAA